MAASGQEAGPLTPDGQFTRGEAHQAKRLFVVLVVVSLFFVAELVGALTARSVVLVADAFHLLMDVVALAMSLAAMRLAVRAPSDRFTFGLRRAEPVAAVINAMLVLGATVEIVREALEELAEGGSPRADIMLIVASLALVVNGISAWLLHGAIHHHHPHGHSHHDHDHDHHDHDHAGHRPAEVHEHAPHAPSHEHNTPSKTPGKANKLKGHALNLRGAWLHLLGDTLGSLAALVAAIVIRSGGPTSIDPVASFFVAAILAVGALRLIRDASLVLLEAAPTHLPVGAVREVLLAHPGVEAVLQLNVWTLGGGHDAIAVHVRVRSPGVDAARGIAGRLRAAFDTEYVTVQVEPS